MTQSNFTLMIDPSRFYVSEAQCVFGVIYFKYGEFSFPFVGWDDFALVILSWWVEAANQLIENRDEEVIFNFMDGPKRMIIRFLPPENLEIKYVSVDEVIRTDIVPIQDCLEELIQAAEKVIEICDNLHFFSGDRTILERQLAKLKSLNE